MKNEIIHFYDYKGNVEVFNSKKEVLEKLGFWFINKNVSKFICSNLDEEHYIGLNKDDYGLYMLRNQYNEPLLSEDFVEDFSILRESKKKYKKSDKKYFWDGEGAVPGTGNLKRYGRYFRHPKTFNLLRHAYSEYEEFEPLNKVRGGRSNIPTAYSDIMKSQTKSWKNYRKNQYR